MDGKKSGVCIKCGAYLTLEAALVIPVVLGVIMFVIYLLFFQYNRCLLEQNVSKLSLRGCSYQTQNREEIAARIIAQSGQEDNRFWAWELGDVKVTIKGNRVRVERNGEMEFPFKRLMQWEGDAVWKSHIVYESYRIEPVEFIRNCNKIMGGK